MSIKRLINVGGITNITRYIGLMFGSSSLTLSSNSIVLGTNDSPYVYSARFDTAFGFGSKYADPTGINANTYDITFNNARTVVGVVGVLSSYAYAFPFSSSGFGTKYSDPAAALPGTGNGISFSTSDNAVLIAHSVTPYVSAYSFSSGFGTKYSNPAALPAFNGDSAKLTDSYAFIGHDTTPYISAYPFNSSTGFGTKYSDPATVGTYGGYTIDYNSTAGAVAYGGIGYVYAYPWSPGFGTKYANPSVYPGSSYGLKFNRAGTAIIVANASSPYIYAYPWSSGWGTKYSNPASLPISGVFPYNSALTIGYYDNVVAITQSAAPYIQAYNFNTTTGLGTKYSNPTTTPAGISTGIAFN